MIPNDVQVEAALNAWNDRGPLKADEFYPDALRAQMRRALTAALATSADAGEVKCPACDGATFVRRADHLHSCTECGGTGISRALPPPEQAMAERVERLTKERDDAFAANERDRSFIADARNQFKDALARRSWLLQGRGSYEWDDDRWKDEFRQAIEELEAPLEALGKIGIDWSLCPTSPEEIAAARIDWKARAIKAEAELAALNPPVKP